MCLYLRVLFLFFEVTYPLAAVGSRQQLHKKKIVHKKCLTAHRKSEDYVYAAFPALTAIDRNASSSENRPSRKLPRLRTRTAGTGHHHCHVARSRFPPPRAPPEAVPVSGTLHGGLHSAAPPPLLPAAAAASGSGCGGDAGGGAASGAARGRGGAQEAAAGGRAGRGGRLRGAPRRLRGGRRGPHARRGGGAGPGHGRRRRRASLPGQGVPPPREGQHFALARFFFTGAVPLSYLNLTKRGAFTTICSPIPIGSVYLVIRVLAHGEIYS